MNKVKVVRVLGWILFFCAFTFPSAMAQVPKIADVPDTLDSSVYQKLSQEKAVLLATKETLMAKVQAHNTKCGSVEEGTPLASECAQEQMQLENEKEQYVEVVTKFNQEVAEAIKPSTLSERAARLIAIFDKVSREMKLPEGPPENRNLASLNCRDFFLHIGDQLARDGDESWRDDFKDNDSADDIARKINEASVTRTKWEKLTGDNSTIWEKAQELANNGAIVVGCMPSDNSGHGHLGFVFPVPGDLKASVFDGHGPFVRDGNEHQPVPDGRVYPSTYGAVKASKAFVLLQTSWYVWMPSEENK